MPHHSLDIPACSPSNWKRLVKLSQAQWRPARGGKGESRRPPPEKDQMRWPEKFWDLSGGPTHVGCVGIWCTTHINQHQSTEATRNLGRFDMVWRSWGKYRHQRAIAVADWNQLFRGMCGNTCKLNKHKQTATNYVHVNDPENRGSIGWVPLGFTCKWHQYDTKPARFRSFSTVDNLVVGRWFLSYELYIWIIGYQWMGFTKTKKFPDVQTSKSRWNDWTCWNVYTSAEGFRYFPVFWGTAGTWTSAHATWCCKQMTQIEKAISVERVIFWLFWF